MVKIVELVDVELSNENVTVTVAPREPTEQSPTSTDAVGFDGGAQDGSSAESLPASTSLKDVVL